MKKLILSTLLAVSFLIAGDDLCTANLKGVNKQVTITNFLIKESKFEEACERYKIINRYMEEAIKTCPIKMTEQLYLALIEIKESEQIICK